MLQIQSDQEAVVFQAIKSSQRVFTSFLEEKTITHFGVKSSKGQHITNKTLEKLSEKEAEALANSDPQYKVRTWIRKRYFECCSFLIELLLHSEIGLQLPALQALLVFEKLAGSAFIGDSGRPYFWNMLLPWITAIVLHTHGHNDALMNEFKTNYLQTFDDVRLFFLKNLATLTSKYDPSKPPTHGDYYDDEKRKREKSNAALIPTSEAIVITKKLPFITSEAEFHMAVYHLLSDVNMASTQDDINNFLVQTTPSTFGKKNDSKKNGANNKKRKRNDMNGEVDESDILAMMKAMEQDDETLDEAEGDSGYDYTVSSKLTDIRMHKSQYSKAWLALMGRKLDVKLHMNILQGLEKKILPYMVSPVSLFDYLAYCYTAGGVLGMLSLGGLFVLLRKYNVEYPEFFPRLYTMFTPAAFFVKQRKRFFELSALFLEGAVLPLYVQCAFLKRFSRLSLTASPQGCMLLLAITYKMLLKHSALRVLVHRAHDYSVAQDNRDSENEPKLPPPVSQTLLMRLNPLDSDPYNAEETDLTKCRAIESSLWEMKLLLNHCVPSVATLAHLIFGNRGAFKESHIDLNDIIEQSYQSLFDLEVKRKNNNVALQIQPPSKLFQDPNMLSSFALVPQTSLMNLSEESPMDSFNIPSGQSSFRGEKKAKKDFKQMSKDRKNKRIHNRGEKRMRKAF